VPNFVVFIPKSDFTFDHGLRGLYFSFILAICLRRILLVDWPDFEKAYDPPLDNMVWSVHHAKFKSMYAKGTKSICHTENAESFRLQNLFAVYSGQFVINQDRISPDRLIFQNKQFFEHLPPVFFGSLSRMRRTGLIMSFLLSRPSDKLMFKVRQIREHIGYSKQKQKHTKLIAVHVPVPTQWLARLPRPGEEPKFGDPASWGVLPGVVPAHWECVRNILLNHNFEPNNTVILFTTNRQVPGVIAKAEEEIGRFGRVVNWEERPPPRTFVADPIVHNERQKAIAAFIDPNIVNGYLLGQSDISVTSGTTYGIFHAARTNFRQPIYIVKMGQGVRVIDGTYYPVPDPLNDYCGTMLRIDKPLEVDIEY